MKITTIPLSIYCIYIFFCLRSYQTHLTANISSSLGGVTHVISCSGVVQNGTRVQLLYMEQPGLATYSWLLLLTL